MTIAKNIGIKIVQDEFNVGNIKTNAQKILQYYKDALEEDVEIIVFPELCITGYPAKDLYLNKEFIEQANDAVKDIISFTNGKKCKIILGTTFNNNNQLCNGALIIDNGTILHKICKSSLPNFQLFNEKRYFNVVETNNIVNIEGFRLAIFICQDIWEQSVFDKVKHKNIDCIIVINASPYCRNKLVNRLTLAKEITDICNAPLIYLNKIGVEDDVIFDGSSFVINKDKQIVHQLMSFKDDNRIITLSQNNNVHSTYNSTASQPSYLQQHYQAMIFALKGFLSACNLTQVVIGLSGGIDSAITATIAVDALGAQNVHCVMMPTRFTSRESIDDAANLIKNLGAKYYSISIDELFESYKNLLSGIFTNYPLDITEENIQARIRGNILMAISNKFKCLLLSTGNKSEIAVGYCTLYGDMCGGYNLIRDLYKTEIFEITKWRNKNIPSGGLLHATNVIPKNIITKAPTAELKENQKDQDSLPPYEILDIILIGIIEKHLSFKQLEDQGYDDIVIKKVFTLLKNAEFKRRQSPPGPILSEMSFDTDRQYPISNYWECP